MVGDEVKLCKKGHKMTRVGRGDKKRWVCNKCAAAARRAKGPAGSGRKGRRGWLMATGTWWASGLAEIAPRTEKVCLQEADGE